MTPEFHPCPTCGFAIPGDALRVLADDAAQSQLEGGDTWSGGELFISCPACDKEIVLDAEGHTETTAYAVVEKAVVRRG